MPVNVKTQIRYLAHDKLPAVEWRFDSLLTADFNDDRLEDYAISGRAADRFYIAVILSPLSQQSPMAMLDFGIGGAGQDDLCEGDSNLTLENLDYDPNENLGATLTGFKRSPKSHGIIIGGDMCDKIHVYWNHTENKLGWWRL